MLVCFVVLVAIRFRILSLLINEEIADPFGFIPEVRMNAAIFTVEIGALIVYYREYTRHAIAVHVEARGYAASSASLVNRMDIGQIEHILSNDVICNRFEKYADEHFFGESAKFIRDARRFEPWTQARSKEAVAQKAAALCKLYISQNGALQLNLVRSSQPGSTKLTRTTRQSLPKCAPILSRAWRKATCTPPCSAPRWTKRSA